MLLIIIIGFIGLKKKNKTNTNIFENNKYYHKEYLDRYINYYKNNDYSIDETILRVNIGLDKKFYSVIETINNVDNINIIVNKRYKLPDNYIPNDLISINNVKLRAILNSDLNNMINDMKKDNLYIILQSGYRSYEYQTYLYNKYVKTDGIEESDTYSARPGHSEHQTGLAIDFSINGYLDTSFENTKEFEWLNNNSYKYGFILRYPKNKEDITGYSYEPWHYRYVGKDIAFIIHNENITYEEYVVKYLNYY